MKDIYRIICSWSERFGNGGFYVTPNATYGSLEQAKEEAEKMVLSRGLSTSDEVIIVKEVLRARPKTYWE